MFERELAEYELRKAELFDLYEGWFVVFRNEEMLDAFYSWQDAFRQGRKYWGDEPFMVKEVRQSKDQEIWYAVEKYGKRIIIQDTIPMTFAYVRNGKIKGKGINEEEAIEDLMEVLKVREWLES